MKFDLKYNLKEMFYFNVGENTFEILEEIRYEILESIACAVDF